MLDGCVSVSLDVQLGCLPFPSQASKTKRRKRSPAYFRRQERRREEAKKLKATAAEAVVKADSCVTEENVTEAGRHVVSEAVKIDKEENVI